MFLGFYWIYVSQRISSRDIVTESQFLKMSEVLDTNSPKKASKRKILGSYCTIYWIVHIWILIQVDTQ